ncbi:unnamed protein product [Chrysodeixis includens]|uniref:Uncharacterized protein n=1 Tax=Chrysodeixis includens TaxID=689277 RepID=A0A9N8Q172_CHRIL|nr:unnamed protein product [Chrysodeixis includens]
MPGHTYYLQCFCLVAIRAAHQPLVPVARAACCPLPGRAAGFASSDLGASGRAVHWPREAKTSYAPPTTSLPKLCHSTAEYTTARGTLPGVPSRANSRSHRASPVKMT